MEYVLLVAGFTSFQAYASSWRFRKPINMPSWWQSPAGRLVLTLIDLASLVLFAAIGYWGFIAFTWWMVILIYVVAGLLIAPMIPAKQQPFTTATFCALVLICVNVLVWL